MKTWKATILQMIITVFLIVIIYLVNDKEDAFFVAAILFFILLAIEINKEKYKDKDVKENKMIESNFECKTCRNPYYSRTLAERQNQEVTHHFQYGWECSDKEKYLQSDGGIIPVRKILNASDKSIEPILENLKDLGVIKSWYYNGTYHAE